MARIIFIYSLAMAVAGGSLVTQSPPEPSEPEPTPVRMTADAGAAPLKRVTDSGPDLKPIPTPAAPEPEPRLAADNAFEIHFLVGEVDLDGLKKLNPEIHSGGATVSLVNVFAGTQREFTMAPAEFQAIQHCLESIETLNVVATSQVIAQSGQSAKIQQAASRSTGSATGIRTVSGEVGGDRLEAGMAFEAKLPASPQGAVRIQIDLGELSPVRPRSGALAGDFEVCSGETCVAVLGSHPGSETSKVTFVAVTVKSANQLKPVAEASPLEPIPEQSDVR